MMSATPGFGRFGSGLGADCFLAAAFPSTALPRPFSAPFTRPFILALACDLGPAALAGTIRSFLPIHASRTARFYLWSSGSQSGARRGPYLTSCFFKSRSCRAAQHKCLKWPLLPLGQPSQGSAATILDLSSQVMHAFDASVGPALAQRKLAWTRARSPAPEH